MRALRSGLPGEPAKGPPSLGTVKHSLALPQAEIGTPPGPSLADVWQTLPQAEMGTLPGPSSRDVWQTLPQAEIETLPGRSLSGAAREGIDARGPLAGYQHDRPSNVLPIRPQLALAGFSTNPLLGGKLDDASVKES